MTAAPSRRGGCPSHGYHRLLGPAAALAALALAAAPARAAEGTAAAGQCGVCHPVTRVAFERSIHYREGAACTDCHGGNSRTLSVPEAHRENFASRRQRREIPGLCGSCHSDVARMRPYNLPTDQLALYQTSRHGQRLAEGDTRVAVCTDCHGVHDILPPEDPASRVARRNIPHTCGRCHGDMPLMARYGKRDNPLADYLKSIHAAALLEEGNPRAPDCSSCHGVHGAAPPGLGDVDKVCGHCHEPVRRYFLASPHHDALREAGLPECAACHGNHAIARAGGRRLEEACAECHAAGGPQVELARRMEALIVGAREEIARAAGLVEKAERVPIDVEDYQARLQEARTYLTEALPATHALSVEEVERFATRARSIGEEIASEIHEKMSDLRTRRFGLVVFWFYVLLTLAVLIGRRRRWRGEPVT